MFKNLKEENKNLFKIYEPIMKTIKRSFYQLEWQYNIGLN